MSSKEKLSSIIFDNMVLDVNLQNNKKKDVVDGFVDGFQQSRPFIADRAMGFMVRGIYRK